MCISCGCGDYENSHGDERNVTVETLQRAADASDRTIQQVMQSMAAGTTQMLSTFIPNHQSTGEAVKERLRDD